MSTLQNDMIFESINDNWDIRPCFNGVGMWEVFNHDMGDMHEIYDTLDEAITKYHQGKWYDYSVSDFTDTHKLIEIREETE